MANKEILKRKILYRSLHRGTKEMDILLGTFVKKHINDFDEIDLKHLDSILMLEDEILYKWYFDGNFGEIIPDNKVSNLLKKFKL